MWNADRFEQLDGARPRGTAFDLVMDEKGLGNLIADREDRVQRRHRLLEDERDLGAAHRAHLGLGERQQIASPETDAASGDSARRLDQPQNRHRRDRLAAARLADEPERLARPHLEAHVVDGRNRAASAGRRPW